MPAFTPCFIKTIMATDALKRPNVFKLVIGGKQRQFQLKLSCKQSSTTASKLHKVNRSHASASQYGDFNFVKILSDDLMVSQCCN